MQSNYHKRKVKYNHLTEAVKSETEYKGRLPKSGDIEVKTHRELVKMGGKAYYRKEK